MSSTEVARLGGLIAAPRAFAPLMTRTRTVEGAIEGDEYGSGERRRTSSDVDQLLVASVAARLPCDRRPLAVELGDAHLERVRRIDRRTGATDTCDVRHPFTMTGADPCTDWLQGCLALDARGFARTGPTLAGEDLASARWPLTRAPYPLESSLPGDFANGDVRAGNVQRVASVGEGSIAISFVHQVLQE
jgi:thioredoxin reductase